MSHPQIISREEAKSQGLKFYFTGKPCKNGHVCKRYTSVSKCVECAITYAKKWRTENPDTPKKYYEIHREKIVEYKRQYRKENPEKVRAIRNESARRRWKAVGKAATAQKKLKIKRATPPWANLEAIKEFYANCPKGYHVDHIHPLQGELISGLHVENNLQYLTAEENLRKGNSFNPN